MENKQKLATLHTLKKWFLNVSAWGFILMIGVLFCAIWWNTSLLLKIGGSLLLLEVFCVVYIAGINKAIAHYEFEEKYKKVQDDYNNMVTKNRKTFKERMEEELSKKRNN